MERTKKTTILQRALYIATTAFYIILFFQGCKKISENNGKIVSLTESNSTALFYFNNCSHPDVSGKFVSGRHTKATVTLVYVNSPGGSYPSFTSATVNGIKLSAPAGTLTNSTGSIVFTASGIPVNPGYMSISVSIAGSSVCNVPIAVLNAPPSPDNCSDPGPAIGSTGCVTFIYRGKEVTYSTVRATDDKIWLQQNLGSPQVAFAGQDSASFGDYFQWGRWDDGHQAVSSGTKTGGARFRDPSDIPDGNSRFIVGTDPAHSWWGKGGSASDTWSGNIPTATNGIDPSAAIGPGWHIPSSTEWVNLINAESIFDAASAFQSNLKLTESGYRTSGNGAVVPNFVGGYYWTSTAFKKNVAKNVFIDASYNALVTQTERGYGFCLRCVKD